MKNKTFKKNYFIFFLFTSFFKLQTTLSSDKSIKNDLYPKGIFCLCFSAISLVIINKGYIKENKEDGLIKKTLKNFISTHLAISVGMLGITFSANGIWPGNISDAESIL
jgi:hypothetical protein